MVQARALFVAIALTVIVPSIAHARLYPCWMIRAYVATHTRAEVDEMARKHRATPEERRAALACLRKKD